MALAFCIRNRGCIDLEPRGLYRVRPDSKSRKEGYLRVVDKSGEDYLYPASDFRIFRLSWAEALELLREKADVES